MAQRKVKTTYLSGRADSDLKDQVDEYVEAADISMGQLVRKAVIEYMENHPNKEDE